MDSLNYSKMKNKEYSYKAFAIGIIGMIVIIFFLKVCNCQAQTRHINILDKFNHLESKIDSLEKRITELENRCVVLHIDSIPAYYQTWGDSAILKYEKRFKVVPYKEQITESGSDDTKK